MKKLTLTIMAIIAMAAMLCACSGNNNKPLSEVYEEIKLQVTLSEMNEFKSAESLDRYYGIVADDIAEFAGGINNSGVNQEEIVLIKAVDNNAAARVKEALNNRYNAKYNENKNYNPEQAEMIEKCSVEQKGLYVTMIVSENYETITQIFNDNIK